MRLKRLRISGFKSFGDSIEIAFKNHGISAIVGPNGCGKSNVVDAIRWVLGEQSARLLRGGKMIDIIFSGTTTRAPVGAAEVSMILSNAQRDALEKYNDYHEIAITRRLYRSGESEYLINNLPCRLMDIRELMMDTGAAGRSYSIIEQGRVEAFITASAEDRRVFMEEAAGVMRYKVARNQALHKLEQTQQNMARLDDILYELTQQENTLREQMRAVLERRGVEQTLLAAEQVLHHQKVHQLQQLGSSLKQKQQEIYQSLQGSQTELQTQQASLQALKLDQERTEHALRENTTALRQEEQRLQRTKAEAGLQAQQCQDATRWLAHWQAQSTNVQAQQLQLQQDAAHDPSDAQSIHQQLATAKAKRQQAQTERETQTQAQTITQAKVVEAQAAQAALRKTLADLEGQTNTIVQRKQLQAQALQEQQTRLTQATQQQQQAQASLTQLQAQHADLSNAQTQAEQALQTQQAAYQQALKGETKQAQQAKEALRQEMTVRSRREALLQLEARNQHLAKGLSAFLAWSKQNPEHSQRLGILGTLESWLEASPAALREHGAYVANFLNLVLLKHAHALPEIQGVMTEIGCEGLGFIPLQPQPPRANASPTNAPILANSLSFSGEAEPLNEWLFQAIWLHQSPTIPQPYPQPWGTGQTWLGPKGNWQIGPKGQVTLGQHNAPMVQHLERKAELQDLAQGLQHAEAQRQQEETTLNALQTEVGALRNTLNQTKVAQSARQAEAKQLDSQLRKQQQWLATRKTEVETLTQKQQQASAETQSNANAIASIHQAKQQAAQQQQNLSQRLEKAQQTATQKTQTLHQAAEALTQARLAETRLEEQQKLSAQAAQKSKQQQAQLAQNLSQAQQGQAEQEARLKTATEAQKHSGAQQTAHHASCQALEKAVSQLGDESYEYARKYGEQQRQLQKIQQQVERLKAELQRTALKLAQDEGRVKQLHEEAAQKAEIRQQEPAFASLQAAKNHLLRHDQNMQAERLENETALQTMVAGLRRRLGDPAGLNLGAPEEHTRLNERLSTMRSQKDDLEHAANDLQRSIQRMNNESRKRFMETFHSVNQRFQTLFPEVFGGGSASLELTPHEDPLQAGVNILASPPGKRPQTLNLLSGGEKALTAIALIFSFFLHKPSPFCVLDEVDAPLDDANVGRFTRLVASMSQHAQFIVITHNKRSMEAADSLYGVTMEEAGVSKLVSVRLDNSALPFTPHPSQMGSNNAPSSPPPSA